MTRRDRIWRSFGGCCFVTGCALGVVPGWSEHGSIGVLGFALAMTGLVLLVQGKRVPATWKIVRSRHYALPEAIVARRRAMRSMHKR